MQNNLIVAAQAVVDQWDSPNWKTKEPTAKFIENLRRALKDATSPDATPPALQLAYRNWRGETSVRNIQPIRLEYSATEWHPEPQWLLVGIDLDKNVERSFALKDFNPPVQGMREPGNDEQPRYTTRRLHEEIRKAEERGRQYEREAALSAAEPVWWLVKTDMARVIFHGPDKLRADRVAKIHGIDAEPLYAALPALTAQVQDVAGNGLTLSALQSAHVERQEEWCPDVKPDLSFRGNELGGECGEAQNVIKKLERERHGWRGSRDTVEHLAEELADVIHCTMLVAITAGIDLQQSVVRKFNDTSAKNGLSTTLAAAPAKQEG